jgi:hypothetical protein
MKDVKRRRVPADTASLEIGKIVGQEIAFATVAGRCSAAQAAALQQMRHDKVHTRFGLTWREFCTNHLKMSGAQADLIIRLLHEFGPDYFEHTQSVRIKPDTYRLIAPFIHENALHYQDQVMELNSANVQKLAESLRESLPALPAPAEEAAPPPGVSERIADLRRRVTEIAGELRAVAKDAGAEPLLRSQFRGALVRMNAELQRVLMENGVV